MDVLGGSMGRGETRAVLSGGDLNGVLGQVHDRKQFCIQAEESRVACGAGAGGLQAAAARVVAGHGSQTADARETARTIFDYHP